MPANGACGVSITGAAVGVMTAVRNQRERGADREHAATTAPITIVAPVELAVGAAARP